VLREVSLELEQGQVLGVVGESGSGKTTLARAVAGLVPWQSGKLRVLGQDLTSGRAMERQLRRQVQMVFQNPASSLDPRMTIEQSLCEPLRVHEPELDGQALRRRAADALGQVGLAPEVLSGYPARFSGGQCQRIAIARALVLRPALLICDEAVSALDVSVQAQVLNLLMDRGRHLGLAMLFISHDLAVVRHVSDWIAVMYRGRLVETGAAAELCREPAHPYTLDLLRSVPTLGPPAMPVPPVTGPKPRTGLAGGCSYRQRCPHQQSDCGLREPEAVRVGERRVACLHPLR
jgi:oligopeptide transport system ATP-binding protein